MLLVEAGKSDNDIRSKVPALMSGIVHTPEFDWMYKAEPDGSVGGRADVWPAGQAPRRRQRDQRDDVHPRPQVGLRPLGRARRHRLGLRQRAAVLPADGGQRARRRRMARAGRADRGVARCAVRYAITDEWIEAVQQAGYPRSLDLNGARPKASTTSSCRSGAGCGIRPPPATCARKPGDARNTARSASAEDRDGGRPRDRRHHPPRRRGLPRCRRARASCCAPARSTRRGC